MVPYGSTMTKTRGMEKKRSNKILFVHIGAKSHNT